jgi:hypothetical protein
MCFAMSRVLQCVATYQASALSMFAAIKDPNPAGRSAAVDVRDRGATPVKLASTEHLP